MRRLEVIKKALSGLTKYSDSGDLNCSAQFRGISRAALAELIECVTYIVFPEYTAPPKQNNSSYSSCIGDEAILHHTVAHVADIIASQIYSAYLLEGHTKCFVEGTYDAKEDAKMGTTMKKDPVVLTDSPSSTSKSVSESFRKEAHRLSEKITEQFLTEKLSQVRWLLRTDADAICALDVAATSYSEVVLCYPGLKCMVHQRTAHALYNLGAPSSFTRLLTEMAHSATGIDIHPSTSIGHHFFIDHGTGIVIGATAIIGNNVSIYQGVTLGARSFQVDKATGALIRRVPRHPIIEDNVTIYANAVILGRITIGANSIIGGNCWVVRSLPPRSVIAQRQGDRLGTPGVLFQGDESNI